MWKPWRNKTGLAKSAAILATILSIATVSCGLNYVLATGTMAAGDGAGSDLTLRIFIVTGYLELTVMLVPIVGLFVVLVVWLIDQLTAQ